MVLGHCELREGNPDHEKDGYDDAPAVVGGNSNDMDRYRTYQFLDALKLHLRFATLFVREENDEEEQLHGHRDEHKGK